MTIAETDKQIRGVIDRWSVYGAEAILNALARATKNHPILKDDAYLLGIMSKALKRAKEDN